MTDPTLLPHASAFAGLAIGIAARVLAARSPEAEPKTKGFLAGLGLVGLVVGGVVAVASGNPTALLALDPNAVAQACVDVVTTVGLLMAPAAVPSKPAT